MHMTDRTIALRKDDPVYRRFNDGRDGYVLVRGEPGMDRNALIEKAVQMARRNDDAISQRVAQQLMPTKVRQYQIQQRALAGAFGVPGEEPSERTYAP